MTLLPSPVGSGGGSWQVFVRLLVSCRSCCVASITCRARTARRSPRSSRRGEGVLDGAGAGERALARAIDRDRLRNGAEWMARARAPLRRKRAPRCRRSLPRQGAPPTAEALASVTCRCARRTIRGRGGGQPAPGRAPGGGGDDAGSRACARKLAGHVGRGRSRGSCMSGSTGRVRWRTGSTTSG